jgi:hypothetical protein
LRDIQNNIWRVQISIWAMPAGDGTAPGTEL